MSNLNDYEIISGEQNQFSGEIRNLDEDVLVSTPRRSETQKLRSRIKKTANIIKAVETDEKIREDISDGIAETFNDINDTKESLGCDPNMSDCLKSLMNSYKIDKLISKTHFKKVTEMVNIVSNNTQEVLKQLELLELSEVYIRNLFDSYRGFCESLKKYYAGVKDEKDSSGLTKRFNALKFTFDIYMEEYEKVKIFLNRGEKQIIGEKNIGSITRYFFSLTKWIWKYKYILYISGIMLYNVYDYVYLPWSGFGLDALIRLCGSLCYTFASDRVTLGKLMEVLNSSMNIILYSLFKFLVPGFGIVDYIPEVIKKTFQVGKTIVFYLLMHFSIDWIAYIIRIVCKGIVIFGYGLASGAKTLGDIWDIFEDASRTIGGTLVNGVTFIADNLRKSGVAISQFITKIFVDTIATDIIEPSYNYITSIPERLISTIKSNIPGMNWWSGTETAVDGTELVRESLPDMDSLELILTKIGDASSSEEMQIFLDDQNKDMVIAITTETNKLFNNVKETGIMVLKKTEEKIKDNFEDTIKNQGTDKLWNELQNLKFTTTITPYISVILFCFALLGIFGFRV